MADETLCEFRLKIYQKSKAEKKPGRPETAFFSLAFNRIVENLKRAGVVTSDFYLKRSVILELGFSLL